nr:MAG TPA: hypothetical protein [Bacteriophage sp.]
MSKNQIQTIPGYLNNCAINGRIKLSKSDIAY